MRLYDFMTDSWNSICQRVPFLFGETLAAKVRNVRLRYRHQEAPRKVSVAEESFVFWLYMAWGNAAIDIATNALEEKRKTVGALPSMSDVVSYEDAQKMIPNLTSWEFQHIRPMVGIYASEEIHPYYMMHIGIQMMRIGQMGSVLTAVSEQCGHKKIRVPLYSDEKGARVIFLHQGRIQKAQLFMDRERE